jgi:hypothetical protein
MILQKLLIIFYSNKRHNHPRYLILLNGQTTLRYVIYYFNLLTNN